MKIELYDRIPRQTTIQTKTQYPLSRTLEMVDQQRMEIPGKALDNKLTTIREIQIPFQIHPLSLVPDRTHLQRQM